MKKNLFYSLLLLLGIVCAGTIATSCSDDDDDNTETSSSSTDYENLQITSENLGSWKNYALQVAKLLETDGTSLYEAWNVDYKGEPFATTFKQHTNADYFTNALSCIQTIIEFCVEITDEVGNEKIGDPYRKYMAGNTTEALYAVESWYSWHSRDDYANNIRSIRNSYYCSLDSTINQNSLYNLVASIDASLNTQVAQAIETARQAILAIPQPFRNNIGDATVPAAQEACTDLGDLLENTVYTAITDAYSTGTITAAQLDAVATAYADEVVVPTYQSLSEKNALLRQAVEAFYNNPTNETIEDACEAWLNAREPWEKSEAFLFGPVDELGLDPNMDSWPLDQVAIVNIIESGNFDDLNWTEEDSDEDIEASQEVRGFHTLEYLLFYDGKPRTISE